MTPRIPAQLLRINDLERQLFEFQQKYENTSKENETLRTLCTEAVNQKVEFQSQIEESKLETERERQLSSELAKTNEQNQGIIAELRNQIANYAIQVDQLVKVIVEPPISKKVNFGSLLNLIF